jgi:hypothetical protein
MGMIAALVDAVVYGGLGQETDHQPDQVRHGRGLALPGDVPDGEGLHPRVPHRNATAGERASLEVDAEKFNPEGDRGHGVRGLVHGDVSEVVRVVVLYGVNLAAVPTTARGHAGRRLLRAAHLRGS